MERVRPWVPWTFALAIGLLAVACSNTPTPSSPSPPPTGTTPPPASTTTTTTVPPAPPPASTTTTTTVPPAPNNRPTVTVTSSSRHVDVGRDVTLTATITDDETQPGQMTVEWLAPAGSYTTTSLAPGEIGTSAFTATQTARYRAPSAQVVDKGPVFYDLTVRVTERYTGADGPTEHVVTATYRIAVNNSPKELADLGGEFLNLFSDSGNSPETCVRGFADICVGRRQEIEDIRRNRQRYRILSSSWSITRTDIDYNADWATLTIRARFVSRILNTNPPMNETSVGDSILTAIYINDRWYLCESRWAPISTTVGPALLSGAVTAVTGVTDFWGR